MNMQCGSHWTIRSIHTAHSVCAALCVAVIALASPSFAATKPAPPPPPPPPAEPTPPPPPALALDRIRAGGKLVIGYRTDAAPMSSRDTSGNATGYSVAVCRKVADALKTELGLSSLDVQWVVASPGYDDVRSHTVDLVCAADEVTQAHRALVSFSIPIFPGGVAAALRSNASESLQRALEERPAPYQPLWRGTPPPTLEHRTYSALGGSATLESLMDRMKELRLTASIVPVDTYDAGVARVRDGGTDVLFGDRAQLLDAVKRSAGAKQLRVLTRHFTFAPLGLALARNDDDFRLAIDRALTSTYLDPSFGEIYAASFGAPDADTVAFFRATVVPK
jgi:polar amino acid transport system substrate-binding protein